MTPEKEPSSSARISFWLRRLAEILISFWATVGSLFSKLHTPLQKAINSIRPQHNTNNEGEDPQDKISRTVPPKLDPPPPPTNKKKPTKKCRKFLQWGNFVVQVLIFLSPSVYGGIAYRQWHAQLASNEINKSTVVIGQRAFVFVPETIFYAGKDVKTGKKAWLFSPRMENGGNTPALNVHNYASQNSPDYAAIPRNFSYPDIPYSVGMFPNSNVEGGPVIIGPHATLDMTGLSVTDDVLQKANVGNAHVCFWGWVSYEDVFGCGHKTEFCEEVVAMSTDGHFLFNNCSEHNCSDGNCKDYKPTNKPICTQ